MYRKEDYRLRVAIPYTAQRVSVEILDSDNLLQEDGRIHARSGCCSTWPRRS